MENELMEKVLKELESKHVKIRAAAFPCPELFVENWGRYGPAFGWAWVMVWGPGGRPVTKGEYFAGEAVPARWSEKLKKLYRCVEEERRTGGGQVEGVAAQRYREAVEARKTLPLREILTSIGMEMDFAEDFDRALDVFGGDYAETGDFIAKMARQRHDLESAFGNQLVAEIIEAAQNE